MACLSTEKRTYYTERLAKLNAQLTLLDTTMDSAIENGEVEKYRFQDGAGNQSAERRSPKELNELRQSLESQIARIEKILNGTGLMNMRSA